MKIEKNIGKGRKMDFNKELEKYNFLEIDDELEVPNDEVALILNIFSSNIKRLSKEQNKANMAIEELLEIVEDENTNNREHNTKIGDLKTENSRLNNAIIDIMDKIEVMYRGTSSDSNSAIAVEVQRIWESLKESLPTVGITIIDKEKIPYNSQIHTVLETKQDENNENYCVLEIIKCGYVFENGYVRKAKTIVNKLDI